jgi:hypothetical protein
MVETHDLGIHAEGCAQQAFEVGIAALGHDTRLHHLDVFAREHSG